jgi:alpha-L-rhamnosidase
MGATTIWERWDGIKTDSTFETPSMNSFNHYCYGAIGDWMYRDVTGIDTYVDSPGYKHIEIKPHIGGGFTFANADLQTYYGNVSSHWKNDGGKFQLDIEIPANTAATVYIPTKPMESVTENNIALSSANDITIIGKEDNYIVVRVGSGKYHFISTIQ